MSQSSNLSNNSTYSTASPPVSFRDAFHSMAVNKYMCEVPDEFIDDPFNLTGLELRVPDLYDTIDSILYNMRSQGLCSLDVDPERQVLLYGLLHARYILTPHGIMDMCEKYKNGEFGMCPRVFCNGQYVLPMGQSEMFGNSHVKVFCPRCQDIYQPPHKDCAMLDGAVFGRTFPHMFFMTLPELVPQPPTEQYTPRLYGFQVHKSAMMPVSSPASPSSSPDMSLDQSKNENTSPNTTVNSSKKETVSTSPKALDLSAYGPIQRYL